MPALDLKTPRSARKWGGIVILAPYLCKHLDSLARFSHNYQNSFDRNPVARRTKKKKDVYQSDNQTLSHFDMMWYAEISWAEF
jgi:hypothetical protein